MCVCIETSAMLEYLILSPICLKINPLNCNYYYRYMCWNWGLVFFVHSWLNVGKNLFPVFFSIFFRLCRVGHHQEWTREWWIELWQIVGADTFAIAAYHISHLLSDHKFDTIIYIKHTSFNRSSIDFLSVLNFAIFRVILNTWYFCVITMSFLNICKSDQTFVFFSDNVKWSADSAVSFNQVSKSLPSHLTCHIILFSSRYDKVWDVVQFLV